MRKTTAIKLLYFINIFMFFFMGVAFVSWELFVLQRRFSPIPELLPIFGPFAGFHSAFSFYGNVPLFSTSMPIFISFIMLLHACLKQSKILISVHWVLWVSYGLLIKISYLS